MPVAFDWSELCMQSAAPVLVFDFLSEKWNREHKCTWEMDLYVGSLSHEHDPSPTFGTLASSAVSHGGCVERVFKHARGVPRARTEEKSRVSEWVSFGGPVTWMILSSLTLMGAWATRVPSDRPAISVRANAPLGKSAPPTQSWVWGCCCSRVFFCFFFPSCTCMKSHRNGLLTRSGNFSEKAAGC